MTPLSLVEGLLASFEAKDSREDKLIQTLRQQLGLRSFNQNGKLIGPVVNLTAIARQAGLPVRFISHEGCALPGARALLLDVMEKLSTYSLQIERDFLKQEVDRLKTRLARHDSAQANRVVMLFKQKTEPEPTPSDQYTAEDVRNAAQVIPMDQI